MAAPLSFDPIAEAARQWHVHWGPEAVPAMAAVTSIMRAQQIAMSRLNELLDGFGLTFPRYEALMLLYYSRGGALPLGKMSDRLQVHRASVTKVIDKLVEGELVERVAHEHDRRTILARITPAGKLTASAATEHLNLARFGMGSLDDGACQEVSRLLKPLRVSAGDFAD